MIMYNYIVVLIDCTGAGAEGSRARSLRHKKSLSERGEGREGREGGSERERERETETDRERDRQTDRQTD